MSRRTVVVCFCFAFVFLSGSLQAGNILLSGSEMDSSIQSTLTGLGHTSTIVDPSSFGSASFSGYTGIWLDWTSTFNGLASRDTDLINFVTGGGILLAEITWMNGNPVTDYPYGNELSAPPSVNPDTIHIVNSTAPGGANHALMQGLTDASLSNWGNAAHGYFTTIGGFTGVTDDGTPGNWVALVRQVGAGFIVYSAQDISYHIKNNSPNTAESTYLQNALTLQAGGGSVPEPASCLLLGAGLFGLAALRRRRA